jgi:uncharacterized protein (DUF2141 family)
MNLRLVVAATLLGTLFTPTPSAAAGSTLALRLSGFRNADGQVLIAVYRGEDGFPGEPDRAWRKLVTKVSGGRASVDLTDVPPGDYAIAVVHDENSNNQLDTNWLGIPKEGMGTSNNPKGRMGPPRYRDARFEVGAAGATQNIKMTYL